MFTCSFAWSAKPPLHRKPSSAPTETLIQQAEDAWAHRDQPWQTESAITLWEQALQKEPGQKGLYLRLTKAAGRAYRHSHTPKEREYWSQEARDEGAQAVEKNPDNSDAYALYGEALGQWAQAHKGIHSLGAVKSAVKNLDKAVSLNPKNAFAHMLLAQFYEQSPGWISVGDKKKALEHAKRAVEYGPGYAINHLTLAKIYLAHGQKDDARKKLEATLALKPPSDAIPETRSDQETAQEMLKKL